MEADKEARVETLLREARQRPPSDLGAFLETACGGDTALRREVEDRLALTSSDLEPTTTDLPEGTRVGPYRVVRVIGRGGMGTVYLAERADEQFEKQVALKLVGRGQDSEQVLRLFRQERQILAHLDHPNIARLLDGGATAEGAPYVVMEYVEGEPIDEHCERRRLSTADRVRLFRTVCSAVQFAHQNLVVHRDLKPSNILVTADGVPKLLDFGIAKVLSPRPATTQTLTSGWALTPHYASPEQIRGETITTASDVYALGVVLYEILTGRRPYEFASVLPHEIVRVVCEREPAPPSELALPTVRVPPGEAGAEPVREPEADRRLGEQRRRELRGDLDTIVLMALRKEPSRRYVSVEHLSEDLRRHLEGMPVLARKDTLAYRAGKFVTRHRVGVASTVLVVLSLLLGMVATARQARLAQAQKARAERRFDDVRRLARSFLFEIHDEIQDLPGATRARARLVTRGLEYLDGLAHEAKGDLSLQAELAEAYLKVGDVQGRPGFSNLGDRAGAALSYRKAVELREEILAQRPGEDAQRELATALDRVGDTERVLGNSKAALDSYERALALREPPGAPGESRDRATSLQRIADMRAAVGDKEGALETQSRALALQESVAARQPGEGPVLRELFIGRVKMGDRLSGAGDHREALERYRAALATSEQIAARDPRSARARRELAVCHDKVGDALLALGELGDALREYRVALALRESLVASDRRDAELRRDLSVSHDKIGRVLLARGDAANALEAFRRALSLDETAVTADPESAQARLDVSADLENVGAALLRADRLPEAEAALRRALELRERIASGDPANADVRAGFVSLYANLGQLEVLQAAGARARPGACGRAREWHDKALRLEQEGVTLPPEARDALAQLAAALLRCPIAR